jgi:hypothetical protein
MFVLSLLAFLGCQTDVTPIAAGTEILGFNLGVDGPTEIAAWQATHGLSCVTVPAVRRHTERVVCHEVPASLLAPRSVLGHVSELLVVRTEDGPIHHVSTARIYSLPEQAMADYASSLTHLTDRIGAPTKAAATPTLEQMASKVVWAPASWTREDLQVDLRLVRAGSDTWSVSETWTIPGIEEEVEGRSLVSTAIAAADAKLKGEL